MIPTPTEERMAVIHSLCSNGKLTNDSVTAWEIAWLQDIVMQDLVNKLSDTNPLVFSEVEDGMIN
jgi:hypothetical protein